MVTNGTFEDTTAWNINGNADISGGVGRFLGGGSYAHFRQDVLVVGKTYKLILDCTANSGTATVRVNQNNGTGFTPIIVPEGEIGTRFVLYFEALNTEMLRIYCPPYDATASIDNVECYEVITPSGTWFDNDSGVHTDNIVGNFLTFTMGGQIPFIFQPDNTKQEFAICKLDKPSLNINQEANGVYSASMTFREL